MKLLRQLPIFHRKLFIKPLLHNTPCKNLFDESLASHKKYSRVYAIPLMRKKGIGSKPNAPISGASSQTLNLTPSYSLVN